jgi:putative ABC transport system permease protein
VTIPVLHRASIGYLLRHPWQLALALLGIGIGVAVIVAVDLAVESSRKAFLLSMDTLTGKATHQIIGGPLGVDESLYATLRVDQGLRDIAPVVEGEALINGVNVRVLGVDLFAESRFRSFSFDVDSGTGADSRTTESLFSRFLTESGAVLMSSQTASSLELQAGDRFDVEAGGITYRGKLLGIIGQNQSLAPDNLVVTDIASAQVWLDRVGWLSRIDLRLSDQDPGLVTRLQPLLPAGTQILTAAGRTRSLAEMSAAFMTNLSAMSLLALLVGLFLIYNSVSFAVLQRRGLIGVLRALGLTRGQTFSLVLAEAAVMGVLGALAGTLLGIWLGEHLLDLVSRSVNDLYFRSSVTEVALGPWSLGKGLVAGLAATLMAAALPAAEAASWQPQLALNRSVLEHRSRSLLPVIATAGIGLGLLALMVLQFSGQNLVAGLSAVFMLILGFALLIPALVKALSALLAPLAARLGGTGARLAVSGIGDQLSRTGVATVALAIAVSATIGVSVMVGSFRASVIDWLDSTLQSDVYVGARRSSLDPSLIEALARDPDVDGFSSSRRLWLESEAGRLRLIALHMPPGRRPGSELLDATPEQVWPAFEAGDAVLVSEPYAYRHDVGAGDEIRLMTGSGPRDFPIAGSYRSYDANAGTVLIGRRAYDTYWNDPAIDSVGLFLKQGADASAVMRRLEALSEGRQDIVLRSNQEIRELSLAVFDRTFVITDVLYWLATLVALIGILGAMLALQMERARELAVLRALGMTPGQLGGMVVTQSGTIGLFSGLAALPLGLMMAFVLIEVINRRAFGWRMELMLSWQVLFAALVFSVAAALVAGIYPAWRAARSNPALAMREE